MNHFLSPISESDDLLSTSGVALIIDTARPNEPAIDAHTYLSGLDATGLAIVRRADFRRRHTGNRRFRCGSCGDPVHIHVTSVVESGTTGGSRAFFVHDPRPEPRDCPFGHFAESSSAALIDSKRFNGRPEGARHRALKTWLCDMLRADPNIASADCEVLVIGSTLNGRPTRRRPDVLAIAQDQRIIAFDVQRAPPLMATIDGREAFYAAQGIAWHWIVDADQPGLFQRQGFQDLILPQGGYVLAINEVIATEAIEARRASFCRLHITDAEDRLGFQCRSRTVGLERIFAYAGYPKNGPRPIATDLRALSFFVDLQSGKQERAARTFDLISAYCCTPGWHDAQRDHLPDAIRALVALISAREDDEREAAVHLFLQRKQTSGAAPRDWAFLLARLADADQQVRNRVGQCRLETRAALEAAITEADANRELSERLMSRWAPLVHRLFPPLAA